MTTELTIWRARSGGLVHHVVRYDCDRSWINIACWSPYGQLTAQDVYENHEDDASLVTCLKCICLNLT